MDNPIILTAEIIGTVAFASSGAMLAIRKNMDLFGVLVLGLCVAVGGGILRDIILGQTPPGAFRDPVYAMVAIDVYKRQENALTLKKMDSIIKSKGGTADGCKCNK